MAGRPAGLQGHLVLSGPLTWLPVDTGEGSERDVVLGLVPEPYDSLRRVLTAAWQSTDPQVLELCRRRLAQLASARAELAGVDEGALAELDDWESSARLSAYERAALAFAEQYHYDHNLLSDGPRAALEQHLSRRELVNFVWALHMNDSYIRILSLLDIAPDPQTAAARAERVPPAGARPEATAADRADERATAQSLMDPGFYAAYAALNPVVVRQALVDEVTSEAVRLFNASHQGCLY